MKTLIVFPHGLGDCILATPALRAYKQKGNAIAFAMLERFKTSELFKHNQYVDELFYTKDAWNDFSSFKVGCKKVEENCRKLAVANGYKKLVFIRHSKNGSKIIDCARALGISLVDTHTEIYISNEDEEIAKTYIPDEPFGFIHGSTGVAAKDLPLNYGKNWLFEHKGLKKTVQIGVDFNYDEININAQFAIMKRSSAVCLADSVFYHACCAMDKKVDFVYFARGKPVYRRVHPLHHVVENVVYKL